MAIGKEKKKNRDSDRTTSDVGYDRSRHGGLTGVWNIWVEDEKKRGEPRGNFRLQL